MVHKARVEATRRKGGEGARETERDALETLYGVRREIDRAISRFSHGVERREHDDRPVDAADVLSIIGARARREELMAPDLFSDPAWDIMLDLYHAHLTGRKQSVSATCVGARVPSATALRYLSRLTDEALVHRVPNREDARRSYVELTYKGIDVMASLLKSTRGVVPVI